MAVTPARSLIGVCAGCVLACTTTRSATTDSSSSARAEQVATTAAQTDVRVTGGAVDSVTVIEEYVPAAQSATSASRGEAKSPEAVPAPPQERPHLFRRTTTTTHVAPVEVHAVSGSATRTETHAQATEAAHVVEQRATRWGPPAWAWVFAPVVLLAALLVAWRARRWWL